MGATRTVAGRPKIATRPLTHSDTKIPTFRPGPLFHRTAPFELVLEEMQRVLRWLFLPTRKVHQSVTGPGVRQLPVCDACVDARVPAPLPVCDAAAAIVGTANPFPTGVPHNSFDPLAMMSAHETHGQISSGRRSPLIPTANHCCGGTCAGQTPPSPRTHGQRHQRQCSYRPSEISCPDSA